MSEMFTTHPINHLAPATLAVVPLLVGPLQVLLALVPALLVALGSALLALLRPSTFKTGLRLLWRMKVSVLMLCGLVWAGIHLVGWLLPAPAEGHTDTPVPGGDWPMFRGGPQRLGVVPGSASPVQGGVNWAFNSEPITIHSTPSVVANRVYFSSADLGLFADRGAVYCLDADSGALVWKSTPPGMRAVFSSPAISGRYLVVGEGYHQTQDACVFCLDVTQRGKLLWRFRTRNHVEATPCIYRGRVYVGAGDDGYYCLDLEPDRNGRARVVWHAAADRYQDAETCPVAVDGRIFVGLGIAGQAVVCLDALSGREIWRVPAPYPVFGPPAVIAGKVVVGMGNGDFGTTGEQWAYNAMRRLERQGRSREELMEAWRRYGPAGEVWCIDAATGRVEWRFRANDTIMGAVAADKGRLFFGSRDGFLYCLSLEGREVARWNARTPTLTCPAVTQDYAYFVTELGRLLALDRERFLPVWEVSLGSEPPFFSSPVVARGRVYVGTPARGLLCLGTSGEPLQKRTWAGHLGGPGRAGNVDGSPLPGRGRVLWALPGLGLVGGGPAISAPIASIERKLFVPVAHGTRSGLLCWRRGSDPAVLPEELWSFPASKGVHASPAANRDEVFFVDGARQDAGRALRCVDARSGREKWKRSLWPGVTGDLVLTPDAVLIQDATNWLASVGLNGVLRWRENLGELCGVPAWQEAILVAALHQPRQLVALDRPTGARLWSAPADTRTGPVIDQSTVYLGTATGVDAYNLVDGRRLWSSSIGEVNLPLALDADWIAAITTASQFHLLNRKTGAVRARLAGALPTVPPLLSRDSVIYATPEALMIVGLSSLRQEPWLSVRGSEISAPPVLVDGSVYFATAEQGLVRAGQWP